MNDITPDSVEHIAPGLTLEWYASHRIAAFSLSNISQTTINAFVSTAAKVEANWATDKPRLMMYDLSHRDVTLTPYLRQHIEALTPEARLVAGRLAFVLSKDAISHSMRLFVLTNLQGKQKQPSDIFFTREAALGWLMEALSES
jgi:hypothetical protein